MSAWCIPAAVCRSRREVDVETTEMERLPARVLVVGGSKGVGRRIVEVLTARGSRCAIGYASDDDAARTFSATFPPGPAAPVLAKGDIAAEAALLVEQTVAGLGG